MNPHLWIALLTLVLIVGVVTLALIWVLRDKSESYQAFTGVFAGFTLLTALVLVRSYALVNLDEVSVVSIYISNGFSSILNCYIIAAAIWFIHRIHGLKLPRLEYGLTAWVVVCALMMVSPWSVTFDEPNKLLELHALFKFAGLGYCITFTYLVFAAIRYYGLMVSPSDRVFEAIAVGFILFGYGESMLDLYSDWQLSSLNLEIDTEQQFAFVIPYFILSIYFISRLFMKSSGRNIEKVLNESKESQKADLPQMWAEQFGVTKREIEVIQLTLPGFTNQEIADQLNISLATVKTHLYKIFQKVEVKSRFELAQKLTKY